MERYICFYTTRPFWAGKKPDIESISSDSKLFTERLSEITFIYENNKIYLAICKDGLIMTQIKELESEGQKFNSKAVTNEQITYISKYLMYLNVIQLLLDSALLKEQKQNYFKNSIISPNEAFALYFDKDELKYSGMPDNLTKYYYLGRYNSQYNKCIPIKLDERIFSRVPIKEKVFKTCFEDLNVIIEDAEAIQMLSQINSAVSEYKCLNFRQALVQAWFVIEYFINKKWIKYLLSKQSTKENIIDKNRRDFLTGSDFTAAIMSNVLQLNEFISFDIYKKIDRVRSKRNFAVHNLDLLKKLKDYMKTNPGKKKDNIINSNDCCDAFIVIMDFVKTEYNLDIEISNSFSFSSFV